MRLFIGTDFSDEFKDKLYKFADFLKENKIDRKLKLVEKENLHLTYVFLGDLIDENSIEPLKKVLSEMNSFKSFKFGINEVGFFPSSTKPRVVWCGMNENDSLKFMEIYNALKEKLNNIHIYFDSKFHPHITVARIKSYLFEKEISLMENYRFDEDMIATVDNITLFESVLTPKGPLYREVFKVSI